MNSYHHLYQTTSRLKLESDNDLEIAQYVFTRARQLLWSSDYRLVQVLRFDKFFLVDLIHSVTGESVSSIYLKKSFQKKGLYPSIYKHAVHPKRILTLKQCDIVDYLYYQRIRYESIDLDKDRAYSWIEETYSNTRAKTSNILYMNHIDEGLFILKQFGASSVVSDAFALHPLVQKDDDLKEFYSNLWTQKTFLNIEFDSWYKILILMLEYRKTANSYLSSMSIDHLSMSPLDEIRLMLIADKVQNKKDLINHNQQHPRFKELVDYFDSWLEFLRIDETLYQQLIKPIRDLEQIEEKCLHEITKESSV